MKLFVFAVATLLAGVASGTEVAVKSNERFIDGIIVGLIEDFSKDIQERGLDPMRVNQALYEYKLPVTDLLHAFAEIEDFLFEGLSNIRINRINFSILTTRLQLDISLPKIYASVVSANAFVKILDKELTGQVSGSFGIEEIRVVADVRVNVGIIGGISIRNLTINFTLGGIKSALDVNVFGHDLSDSLNRYLGETLPNSLEAHRAEINKLLEHVVREIVEEFL